MVWKWLFGLCVALMATLHIPCAEAREIPRHKGTYVNDYAGIIPTDEARALEKKLALLRATTAAQVYILTVKSLEGEALFTFTQRTFDAWKPGERKKDKGLLIVFALDEQGRRVHPGYGLEEHIPDAEALRIIKDKMDPHLKKKEYGKAFAAAVDRIEEILSGEAKAPEIVEAKRENDRENAKYFLFLIAAALLVLAHIYHPVLGGFVGAGAFAGTAWLIALSDPVIIAAAIFGGIVGLTLRWLAEVPWCGGGCASMASAAGEMAGAAGGAGADILGGLS
jgi:uncharacterized protein